MNFDIKLIKQEILSPGNIFWKKRSGDLVLITQKGDVINYNLVQKLIDTKHEVIVTDEIDPHQRYKFTEIYKQYCEIPLVRDKIGWRDQLIDLLREDFIVNQKPQFELNQLAWNFFSKFSLKDIQFFANHDSDIFKRHLTIASNYTFGAFLLGYYEPTFLNSLFTSTFANLMELGSSIDAISLKEKIEHLRIQDSFQADDIRFLKEIASDEILNTTVLFEKFDGSGIRKINAREMTDLEIFLIALCHQNGVGISSNENIFLDISRDNFDCEPRLLRTIQIQMMAKEKKIEKSA